MDRMWLFKYVFLFFFFKCGDLANSIKWNINALLNKVQFARIYRLLFIYFFTFSVTSFKVHILHITFWVEKDKSLKCFLFSVSPCVNNPCENNGTCTVDVNGNATCTCDGNWNGTYCQGNYHSYEISKEIKR